jgi:hypothetical protein
MAPSRQLKLELGSEALLRPGLPDGLIKTKYTNLGIFWRALEWKMLVYFTAGWYNNYNYLV